MKPGPRWLIAIALAIVIMVLITVLITSKPPISGNEVFLGVNAITPISINVPIYVVGPPTLVQKLTALGINQSLIRLITMEQLPELPNDSLVIIDWSTISPSLTANENGTIYVSTNSSNFELLSDLIGHGDFVIIHGNASNVPAIELALALAWSRAYNTSVTAAPIPQYLGGLDYVIAYGNDKALVIGPYTLASALDVAINLWIPLTMRRPIAYIGSGDVCQYLIQNYSLPMNQSSQAGSVYRYVIDYGGQAYGDSLGIFIFDTCILWGKNIDENYGGRSIGFAKVYNFIAYLPTYGTFIKRLTTFQDAYASYMTYEYLRGKAQRLPPDVWYVAVSRNPSYWTNTAGFGPTPLLCSIVITYSLNTLFIPIQSYSCPPYTVSVYGVSGAATPLGLASINSTWVFAPGTGQYATQPFSSWAESWGFIYLGPVFNPQPSALTIPVGATAIVTREGACTYKTLGLIPTQGTLTQHITYKINWDIWYNPQNPKTGIQTTTTPQNQNPHQTTQCQPTWQPWW